jgi:hypothetical protein
MLRKMLFGSMFMAMMATGGALYAQDHSQHGASAPAAAPAGTQAKVSSDNMEHIFCPTMKTGQVCSHGTAASLGVTGTPTEEQWVAFARKYNRAVNSATEQLFTDAETILSAEQVKMLKAWFAVGLNPQINDLLYAQGLGREKVAAAQPAATPEPAAPAAAK